MKRMILALALMVMPLLAQYPQGQDPNERINKLVTLKYVDPAVVRNLLNNFQVDIRVDNSSMVISLSGARSHVMAAEDAIKQLDIPGAVQKDIELTVYFVMGTDNTTGGPGDIHSAIPKDLDGTVATLKTTFPFKTYYLLDTLGLRTRAGVGANSTGQLSSGRLTTFSVRSASLEGDSTMIRLDNLKAGLKVPVREGDKTNYLDTGISTDVVDVKEGQKLVVGRSSLNGPDTALFLVLIARVAQ